MKFCKDCKHLLAHSDPEFWRCGNALKTPAGPNPVTGTELPAKYYFCSTERRPYAVANTCGPDGKNHENSSEH